MRKNKFLNIDKKDLAILQTLDQNTRASYIQIAKKTNISKEAVQYRIKQLEKKEIITGYWATPSIGKQETVYKLLIKNKSLGTTKKQEFINYCLKQKTISWFATTEGTWDFVISSYLIEDSDFLILVDNIMKKFGKHFKEKHILKSTAMIIMNEKYLYDEEKTIRIKEDSFLEEIEKTDEIDAEIIKILSTNARATYTEIGKQVKLTPESISLRFKKIMKKELIKSINPRINHNKIGLTYYHLFLAVSDYEKKDTICKYYTQHPDIIFIMKHIGYYDIHLELAIPEEKTETIIEELTEKFGETISNYELLKIKKEHIMIVIR